MAEPRHLPMKRHSISPYDPSKFDVIVVGGGIAGLYAAFHLAPLRTAVITAAPLGQGASSAWAQGGIAAALAEEDSIEAHLTDTIKAGAGLVAEHTARLIATEAETNIDILERLGVKFDRTASGTRLFSLEAAHSHRRVLKIGGDQAGKAMMTALTDMARESGHITVIDQAVAEEIIAKNGEFQHLIFSRGGTFSSLGASHLLLATGGIGGLFATTTNPAEARGQGLVLAARAGALLADLEFIQFHPTALAVGLFPSPLLTEALRGEGAKLIDRSGAPLMPPSEPLGDLAPRDIVASAVHQAIEQGRGAFLDCRQVFPGSFAEHFPQVHAACEAANIDPALAPLPIAPAAHYHMGGVVTDHDGRTQVGGLWAAGEVACTGVHGANRLASNSLLEALVFARRAALAIKEAGESSTQSPAPASFESLEARPPSERFAEEIRNLMASHLGVARSSEGLREVRQKLESLAKIASTRSEAMMLAICSMINDAALARPESRGAHRRTDCPKTSEAWQFHQAWTLPEGAEHLVPAGRPWPHEKLNKERSDDFMAE